MAKKGIFSKIWQKTTKNRFFAKNHKKTLFLPLFWQKTQKTWVLTHVFYKKFKSRRDFFWAQKKEKKNPKVGRPKPLFFRAPKNQKKPLKNRFFAIFAKNIKKHIGTGTFLRQTCRQMETSRKETLWLMPFA